MILTFRTMSRFGVRNMPLEKVNPFFFAFFFQFSKIDQRADNTRDIGEKIYTNAFMFVLER